jgi:hypothetical protein
MEGDAAYFARRAREERIAAMKAAHPNAREAHLDMARRYHELASAIASHELLLSRDAVSAVDR